MTEEPLYPNIKVTISPEERDAYTILTKVKRALKRNDVPLSVVNQYIIEATADDMDMLQTVTKQYVRFEQKKP